MNDPKSKIITVVGPTGSGKTRLGVELAQVFNGVVISADSRQVYRGLDRGTNKEGVVGSWQGQPARIIDNIPQLLVDIVPAGAPFNLADWLEAAKVAIRIIQKQNQLPIIVGGTGLYVTALTVGYQPGGGRGATRRLSPDFDSLLIQPKIERETLDQKSNQRISAIFDDLVRETRELINQGVSSDWLEKIGLDYRYAVRFLNGQLSRSMAIDEAQAASRQYIGRQQTWWRHHGTIVTVASVTEARAEVERFLKNQTK